MKPPISMAEQAQELRRLYYRFRFSNLGCNESNRQALLDRLLDYFDENEQMHGRQIIEDYTIPECEHCQEEIEEWQTGVNSGFAFDVTVIVLCAAPTLPLLSKTIFIKPVSPGKIGFSGFCGTVQPQLAVASIITKGLLPVFLNR